MPFTLRACLFGLLIVAGVSLADSDAAWVQDLPQDLKIQPPLLELPPDFYTPPREGEYAVQQSFDLNGDDQIDLAVEWTTGRGPLSTYYASFRIVAQGSTKILRSGKPVESGTELSLLDLTTAISEAPLCTVGGSLRFPELPARDFSGGPWLGKNNQALAVAIVRDSKVQLGYVNLTVTNMGKITLDSQHFVTLTPAKVIVEAGE